MAISHTQAKIKDYWTHRHQNNGDALCSTKMSCLSLAIYHYRRPEISAGARASFNKIAAARQEDQNDVDGEIWPGERVATTTTTRDGCRKQHEEKKNTDSNHYSNNHSSQQDSLSSQKTAKLNLVCPIASRTTVAAGGGGCGLPRPGDHSDWAVAVQLSAKKKKKHHNEISQTKTTTTTLSSTNAPKQQQHRLKLFHVIIQLVCLQLFLTRTFKESLAGPVPSGFLDSGHAIACTIGQQVEIRDYIPISDPNLERCVICSCPNGSVDCRRSTDPDCSAKTPPSHAFGNPQKHPSNRLPNGGGGNRVYPTTSGHHHGGATLSHYHHQHTHNHPHHSYSKPPVIGKAKTVAVARKPAKVVATGSGQQQPQQQQQSRSLKQQTTWTGHGLARATTGHNNRQQYGPTMGDLGSPEPSQPDELAETTAQEEVEVRRVVQSPRTTFRYSSAASAPASSDSAVVQPDGPDILRPPRLPLNDPQHRAAAAEALGWSHEKYNSKISQLLSKRASTSTARQQPTTIEITTTTTAAATTTTQPPPPAVLVDATSIEPGDGRGELEPDNTDQTPMTSKSSPLAQVRVRPRLRLTQVMATNSSPLLRHSRRFKQAVVLRHQMIGRQHKLPPSRLVQCGRQPTVLIVNNKLISSRRTRQLSPMKIPHPNQTGSRRYRIWVAAVVAPKPRRSTQQQARPNRGQPDDGQCDARRHALYSNWRGGFYLVNHHCNDDCLLLPAPQNARRATGPTSSSSTNAK